MKKLGIVSKLTLWYSFVMIVIASLMIGFLLYVVRKVTIDSLQKKLVDTIIKAAKEIEYEEIVYEKPEVIIGKIKELEKEITLGLEELEKLVK